MQKGLPENKSIILFDGECNLCNGFVNFVIDHDPEAEFVFTSLQSEAGKILLNGYHLPETYTGSILLLKQGTLYSHSAAVLHIIRRLRSVWRLAYVFILLPALIRDPVYRLVARYRYKLFGRNRSCRIMTPELAPRFL